MALPARSSLKRRPKYAGTQRCVQSHMYLRSSGRERYLE